MNGDNLFLGTLQLLQPPWSVCNQLRVVLRSESSFAPKRVLVLAKMSRYEFEKMRAPHLDECTLKMKILERGSDYDAMLASYNAIQLAVQYTTKALKELNVEYNVSNRTQVKQSQFDWADLIFPIGGDGTFLLASNLIFNSKKPIVGINPDPGSSEGFLMLHPKYSQNVPEIFYRLRNGQFKYLLRNRIRIKLQGDNIWGEAFHVHKQSRVAGPERIEVDSGEVKPTKDAKLPNERRLPWLALNEVFIGESLPARASTLLVKVDEDDDKFLKVKSSGICLSTGTGSTSWHTAINRLTPQVVKEILTLADPGGVFTDEEARRVCEAFNESLRFSPEDSRLSYSVRDMIIPKNAPKMGFLQRRGFCRTLTLRSQSNDTDLVLDGCTGIPFNNGSLAILESDPEDALRSIILPE
ncbi:NAD kinase 2, mitochondrial [Orussus abietinus]|uniref:NAD kinase 2, mitochondrial n=1 Tax=Orussus abietinus TaxID=222816 RepID=UPI000C715B8A|nr:NAD kinase 2, mitochondrial [Orussus abietinus]